MCEVEDEMRDRNSGQGEDWQRWQEKHGRRAATKPIVEIRAGNDGVVREYCTTCRWGWPVGSKPQYQVHQLNCPHAPVKGRRR
jgi:hypothetical protein